MPHFSYSITFVIRCGVPCHVSIRTGVLDCPHIRLLSDASGHRSTVRKTDMEINPYRLFRCPLAPDVMARRLCMKLILGNGVEVDFGVCQSVIARNSFNVKIRPLLFCPSVIYVFQFRTIKKYMLSQRRHAIGYRHFL